MLGLKLNHVSKRGPRRFYKAMDQIEHYMIFKCFLCN